MPPFSAALVTRGPSWLRTLTPFATAAIVFVVGVVAYYSSRREAESTALVERTHEMIDGNQALLARVVDAETGERGYIITGDQHYLAPYEGAGADAHATIAHLRDLADDDLTLRARVDTLGTLVANRLASLSTRVEARKRAGFGAAKAVLALGIGEATMDSIRGVAHRIEMHEDRLMEERHANAAAHARTVLVVIVSGTASAIAIALVLNLMLSRYAAAQERLVRQLEEQNKTLETQRAELQTSARLLHDHALELEEAHRQLLDRTQEAEDANRAKSDFLARMSHELRTPLNAISGYADLMEAGAHGPVTDAQVTDLVRIKRSGRHLMGLINNVLNFSKMEAGGLVFDIEPLLLRDVLGNVELFVAPQMNAKGITLCIETCARDLRVLADREKLDQILINLLTNAYKFTSSGGRITVACDAGDGRGRIQVRDTGRGIPADKLEAIFEPFVQVDARGESGVGLGLAITSELATAMNGTLEAASTLGTGSTFTLSLPLSERFD
ncbi:MAG: CHASE3 domain-containing protein [Gemmatimonadaceae bacterium]